MTAIPIETLEGHLTEMLERAERGEEIVLTRDGAPVARLITLRRHEGASASEESWETIKADIRERLMRPLAPMPTIDRDAALRAIERIGARRAALPAAVPAFDQLWKDIKAEHDARYESWL